jgi:molecular chaperone GrpE
MQDNDNTRPTDETGADAAAQATTEAEVAADAPEAIETDADVIAANFAALEADLAAAKDQQLRALAEVENMRRRAQREREEALKYGAVSLARDLLSVADNLGRALQAAPQDPADPAVKALVEGVAMVERELAGALEKHQVKTVAGVGEAFDHNVHQAVVELESADVPPGHVVQVLQAGYTLHDRLLRPAMVAVAKAQG